MSADAVDGFAGPGGWSEGLRLLGMSDIGLELDRAACLTRVAAGHLTIQADMTTYSPKVFRGITGGIFSPPCTDFSRAGKQLGLNGATGALVFEVVRWVDAIRPQWVACEQVPDVLPIWRHIARTLEEWGYKTWCGLLSSERYGVPQTRLRAILMAHRDHAPQPPAPTHQEYVSGQPARWEDGGMFGPPIRPWVSMAEALGWVDDRRMNQWRGEGMIERHGAQDHATVRSIDEPSPTILASMDNGDTKWLRTRCGYEGMELVRHESDPAPTFTAMAGGQWYWDDEVPPWRAHRNDQTSTAEIDRDWPLSRPSTTIATRDLAPDPGANANRYNGNEKSRNDGVKITLGEALTLQSFREDYPVQGNKTKQFQQVGNAIPPLLAAAVVGALAGADWRGLLWEAA